ncbi:Spy/CpxP family protein refolding chaperone [Viridibacterium curvum]|uniref:Periplasmic heavy metal sensor n=1 Tax=Viridibacterium curvum TaxID=1101404 RepID=A0ABP9QIK1_9RHOO
MSEQSTTPTNTPETPEHPGRCGRFGRHHHCCAPASGAYRWVRLFVIAGLIGAAIFTHNGHCGERLFSRAAEPTVVQARAERMADHVARRVDATDAQRAALRLGSRELASEVQPLIAAHRAARATLYAALSSDNIDAARVEQARSALVQQLDASSRHIADSIISAGQTLTPAQRKALLERWQTVSL